MIEINKPLDTTPNVRCYKCKAEFYVHEMANLNAPYVTDCELHNPKCEHDEYTSVSGKPMCRKCGIVLYQECEHEVNIAYFDSPAPTMKCKKCGGGFIDEIHKKTIVFLI